MRTILVHVLFACAAVMAAGCVSQPEQPPAAEYPAAAASQFRFDPNLLAGTWAGRGCQSDGPCWTIRVKVEADERGNPVGRIAYPSVPCRARLEFVRWEPGDVAAFRERFDDAGKCVPDGWLRLRQLDEDHLGFVWSYPDGRVDAGTTLQRLR